MTKLNKYQKLISSLYCILFIYLSAIHAPFKIVGSNEIVHDTLFSHRANLDINRLLLILVVLSFAFGIIFIVLNNLKFNLKTCLRERLTTKHRLSILFVIIIIGVAIIFMTKKYALLQTPVKLSSDTTITTKNSIVNKSVVKEKENSSNYSITNVKFHSKDNFEEYVTFTFQNYSNEIITNIMFQESYLNSKNMKSDWTNKKIVLNSKDSKLFTFKKNHDKLSVYKIRFATGKTITSLNDIWGGDNIIYDKVWEMEDE